MKPTSLLKLSIVCITAFMLSSCASMFGNNAGTVKITSSPSGAKVMYNGNYMGKTPTTITVHNPVDSNYIQVIKPGYQDTTIAVPSTFQMVSLWNILNLGIGFYVDAATGHIKTVKPAMHLMLDKK